MCCLSHINSQLANEAREKKKESTEAEDAEQGFSLSLDDDQWWKQGHGAKEDVVGHRGETRLIARARMKHEN